MVKRLKELVVDDEGNLREHSGKRVDVVPVGYPIGLAIPYREGFDARKKATFLKNFIGLHQPQCVNLPGIPSDETYSKHLGRGIDYYLINQGAHVTPLDVTAREIVNFDTQGKVTQYGEQTRHRVGAIQFYRQRES